MMYLLGKGVQPDCNQALYWIKKAAENEEATTALGKVQSMLGAMYLGAYRDANGRSIEPNYPEAAKWIKKAAQRGDDNGMLMLGTLYHSGLGLAKDYDESKRWLVRAADGGNLDAKKSLCEWFKQRCN